MHDFVRTQRRQDALWLYREETNPACNMASEMHKFRYQQRLHVESLRLCTAQAEQIWRTGRRRDELAYSLGLPPQRDAELARRVVTKGRAHVELASLFSKVAYGANMENAHWECSSPDTHARGGFGRQMVCVNAVGRQDGFARPRKPASRTSPRCSWARQAVRFCFGLQ